MSLFSKLNFKLSLYTRNMFLIENRLEVFELAYIVFQIQFLDLQKGIDIDILSFFHYLLLSPDEFMKSEREIYFNYCLYF